MCQEYYILNTKISTDRYGYILNTKISTDRYGGSLADHIPASSSKSILNSNLYCSKKPTASWRVFGRWSSSHGEFKHSRKKLKKFPEKFVEKDTFGAVLYSQLPSY